MDGAPEPTGFAEVGDTIELELLDDIEMSGVPWSPFAGKEENLMEGIVSEIFMCCHTDDLVRMENVRKVGSEGNVRSGEVRKCMSFLNFKWKNRESLVIGPERRPLVQPTDFIVVLRPVRGVDGGRVVLVYRHITRVGERERYLFHIHAQVGVQDLYSELTPATSVRSIATVISPEKVDDPIELGTDAHSLDILRVRMLKMHEGLRGTERYKAARVIGELEGGGGKYGIYRCSLYLDGFRASIFNSSSYEGVYLQPLSIPRECREDSASARIITVIPPGVERGLIIREIVDELVACAKVGKDAIDADGNRRKIFVDVVNVLGDTPGLNTFLDFGGHSGDAFCHKCNISKSGVSLLGNSTNQRGYSWMTCAHRRTADRTITLRATGPTKEVLQTVGMPENPTSDRRAFMYYMSGPFDYRAF